MDGCRVNNIGVMRDEVSVDGFGCSSSAVIKAVGFSL